MRLISRALGSAHASRAGERVLAIANFRLESLLFAKRVTQRKVRFGATPKPARETRALPRIASDAACNEGRRPVGAASRPYFSNFSRPRPNSPRSTKP